VTRKAERAYRTHLPISDYFNGPPLEGRKMYVTVCNDLRSGRRVTFDPHFITCEKCLRWLSGKAQWYNRLVVAKIQRVEQLRMKGT
jgi:hypothetical protein